MKIGIIYESKGETTKKCAKELAKRIKVDPIVIVDVLNLKNKGINIDISKYDMLIIGSGIRCGKIYKRIDNFIKKNKYKLLRKDVAYFICCASEKKKDKYFNMNISEKLLNKSICYETFGGELNIKDTKGLNKILISCIKSKLLKNKIKINLNEKNIDSFIDIIKKKIE